MTDTMQEIRRRRKTVESAEHITGAMHLVSAARFRRSKARYDRMAGGLNHVIRNLEQLLAWAEPIPKAEKTVIIVYTASRGLCGGYNSTILKLAVQTLRQMDGTVSLFVIGNRGCEFFRRQGYDMAHSLEMEPEKMTRKQAEILAEAALKELQSCGGGQVLLCGMGYRNTLHQEPEVRRIYPVVKEDGPEWDLPEDLEFLPPKKEAEHFLLKKYLQLVLCRSAAEAAVCEHGARRMAMESAAESARDLLASLTMTYNRARQQAITEELIEIVSGAESLK